MIDAPRECPVCGEMTWSPVECSVCMEDEYYRDLRDEEAA